MSALYLSKVAKKESTQSVSKPVQDKPRESGKRVNLTKMAEDSQQRKDDLSQLPTEKHQPGMEDVTGTHFQQLIPSHFSKEMLYQQRQKCELRRLLKHTHPELKMLDDFVDEEFAEVLSSETATAGETGYEGEVLSRCLIFENCGLSNNAPPYTPKIHMAQGAVERSDFSKTSAGLERPKEGPCTENVKAIMEDNKSVNFRQDPNSECEDEMVRIDVQATRRIFESQSRSNPERFQEKVSKSGDETKVVKTQSKLSEMLSRAKLQSNQRSSSTNLEEQPQLSCTHVAGQRTEYDSPGGEEVPRDETLIERESTSFSDSESRDEMIKTSAALFKNNPFISGNIEREHSSSFYTSKTQNQVCEDYLTANVKTRTHLFESMPFDKIKHQNKDDIETLVENIKETLNFLHCVKEIHSNGAIIEVNETMIAKKAKFTVSESGPQINYDEVAEGGAQNFILQLLPRVNLKPQICYLKEDSKGCLDTMTVDVRVQQHQFNTSKDTEFKTANVMQLVEDILNQDNSLRKGVIIQDDVSNSAEVIVYSLFKYFDEKDVKSYSPSRGEDYGKPEPEIGGMRAISAPSDTSQDQTCPLSVRPEVKGNVKLFKSCIEKGDLEYLKTLQAEPTVQEQELPQSQTVAGEDKELHHEQRSDPCGESDTEWAPVDVKRLKSLFSGDKSHMQENYIQSATISNVSLGKSQSSVEHSIESSFQQQVENTFKEYGGQEQEVCKLEVVPHYETSNDDRMHQAELVPDNAHEISDLQTVIKNLQQTTTEAKSFSHLSQETQKIPTQEPTEKAIVPATSGNVPDSGTIAELPQQYVNQKVESCAELRWNELYSASEKPKPDRQHVNTETSSESENVQTAEGCDKKGQECPEVVHKHQNPTVMATAHGSEVTPAQEEEEEVVFQGTVQAALESLEKSNINVTRGDFRAAMIYRNSNKPLQEGLQHEASVQKPHSEEFCRVTEPESTQEVTSTNAEHTHKTQTLTKSDKSAVSVTSQRPIGPKPAIPPKPEHLKMKQGHKEISQPTQRDQSINKNISEGTQNNIVKTKETAPQLSQPIQKASDLCRNESKQLVLKSNNETANHQRNELSGEVVQMLQETEARHETQGSRATLEAQTDKNAIAGKREINAVQDECSPQNVAGKSSMNETDESPVDFHEACQKFGGQKMTVKRMAPVKPKRVKIVQPDDKNPKCFPKDNTGDEIISAHAAQKPAQNTADPSSNTTDNKNKQDVKQESRVEMREKKARIETEDERRQRLSVHMDEIIRENIPAAMEIFDNLRKQEQLRSILSRVEEIEQDTSDVDVKSLRRVFENVPDWVVGSKEKKQKNVRVEKKDKRVTLPTDRTESKTSMAHVYGDLERASEEIMNLKEQTLARLMDIEEAIKKALYSVSTLKSDSDIAGLSCLFKESFGAVQGSSSSGNISKISIGSSKTKSQEGQESSTSQGNKSTDGASAKQRPSPPSSPAFISIQSAARKMDQAGGVPLETSICPACQQSPKLEEKFRTTKTMTCNSPAQTRKTDRNGGQKESNRSPLSSNREVSVLEVQTDSEGNSIAGTITENYERTDNFGNRFYSSNTSTDTQPETMTTTSQAVISPATYQVTAYPEVQLPINQINASILK
ncbi:xin actin-binding repeat-containing protein 1-like isoform X3 [Leuresthes tenuis]